MKIICLDVGEKRIGVARADSSTRIAIPIGFIEVDGEEWKRIDQIAKNNSTNLFVLGLPRSNDGNETAQSLYVRNFAKTLTTKIPGARVRFQDESLTSVIAEERLKIRKDKYAKGEIDAEAAAIILQDFLENLKNISELSGDSDKVQKKSTSPAASGKDKSPVHLVKKTAKEVSETVTGITKKEAKKVKLNTKIVKHKMKASTKAIISISTLLIIIGGVISSILLINHIREENAKKRAEEYARQEAEMKAATFNFTIRPGETIYKIKQNLLAVDRNGESSSEERIPNYTQEEIDEAFSAQYDFAFLEGRPEGATLEGYLYPETLNFYGDSEVCDILKAFLSEMGKAIVENDLEQLYQNQGLSLFEGITVASIVQKEAPSPEQPTVAQVFLTRLQYGMALGSDVTVSYALDTIDPERQVYQDNSAALLIDSCYNTRLYGGLPCGPISNPGLSALLAVANPSDSSYLYFLTGDDGLMYYSYTESEHVQNIYSHCQELCNAAL